MRLPPLLVAAILALSITGKAELPQRWIYCAYNLSTDKNVEVLDALFHRAAQSGYNGVLLADHKFALLERMDAHYFRNVERVKALAAETKLQIVPAVFPIGYSNGLLALDPNLAEGLPVRDALFVVQGGVARLSPEPAVELKGANFDSFAGWPMHDPSMVVENHTVRMVNPAGANARIMQTVKVHPWRQYHLAVEIKTADLVGSDPQVTILSRDGRSLSFSSLGTKRTQDWKLTHVVFNSLESEEVKIYFGCWGAKSGTVEWRHPKLEEVGLLNLVRREGAPFTLKTDDGPALAEGKDFQPVADPKMGRVPYPGEYDVYHEPPVIHTGLPDGTRLRVSYFHAITVNDGQVMICPSEPKTVALLRDQARRLHAAWGAKGYFMSHDEIRVLNWDRACADRHLDAGPMLADHVRTCIDILREVNPGGDIYVWSDMFDPFHNAHANYYLVNGNLADSWKGLTPEVKIMLWYFGKRDQSLKFFADLKNPMLIAGYYDSAPEKIRDWLKSAAPYPGVLGAMYTTWKNEYRDLEKFAAELKEPSPAAPAP